MCRNEDLPGHIAPAQRAAVIAFLRDWLPEDAKARYREMIETDPHGWSDHPHFAGGFFVRNVLRGNGIDEVALGVPDLEALWRGLLVEALRADDAASDQTAWG
jgi:hypothetical protein